MKKSLPELSVERARLLERIAYQRRDLSLALAPLLAAESNGQRLISWCASTAASIKARPWRVALVVVGVMVMKPRRVLPWLLRGAALWRGWRAIRAALPQDVRDVLQQMLRPQSNNNRAR